MEGENKAKRQTCEIYSRVVGYLRPVDSWNAGKQSEYYDRRPFEASELKS